MTLWSGCPLELGPSAGVGDFDRDIDIDIDIDFL